VLHDLQQVFPLFPLTSPALTPNTSVFKLESADPNRIQRKK